MKKLLLASSFLALTSGIASASHEFRDLQCYFGNPSMNCVVIARDCKHHPAAVNEHCESSHMALACNGSILYHGNVNHVHINQNRHSLVTPDEKVVMIWDGKKSTEHHYEEGPAVLKSNHGSLPGTCKITHNKH